MDSKLSTSQIQRHCAKLRPTKGSVIVAAQSRPWKRERKRVHARPFGRDLLPDCVRNDEPTARSRRPAGLPMNSAGRCGEPTTATIIAISRAICPPPDDCITHAWRPKLAIKNHCCRVSFNECTLREALNRRSHESEKRETKKRLGRANDIGS